MTEIELATKTLPEALARFIRTDKVKVVVDGATITITPMEAELESDG